MTTAGELVNCGGGEKYAQFDQGRIEAWVTLPVPREGEREVKKVSRQHARGAERLGEEVEGKGIYEIHPGVCLPETRPTRGGGEFGTPRRGAGESGNLE